MTDTARIPAPLQAIIDDFQGLDRSEKLEMLLEYAEQLPPLPTDLRTDLPLEHVPECATPIAIATERTGDSVQVHFDIPPESPTVRGFASILRTGLAGATPDQILNLPGDLQYTLGLQNALSPQRLNGMHFMLLHLKRAVTRALSQPE